jgi:hypothetical protein
MVRLPKVVSKLNKLEFTADPSAYATLYKLGHKVVLTLK